MNPIIPTAFKTIQSIQFSAMGTHYGLERPGEVSICITERYNAVTIITVESVACGKPHKTISIPEDAVYRVLGQTLVNSQVFNLVD
jgi:hypothetical protein